VIPLKGGDIVWPFTKKEKRSIENTTSQTLEQIILGIPVSEITPQNILEIPAVSACLERITSIAASLPLKLYKENGGRTNEILTDPRVALLNDDTKDLLSGYDFKKALFRDYYIYGAGYAYINRRRNDIISLNYVENQYVSPMIGADPIFKSADFLVGGKTYKEYDFLKFVRNTKNGVTGRGIYDDNKKILEVAYKTLLFEEVLIGSGGNKKGFLKAEGRVSKETLDYIKEQFSSLYKNNAENVVVLNSGLSFQEASQTSVEMQLNDLKKANAESIYSIFGTPKSIIEGGATEKDKELFTEQCLLPLLSAFETHSNKEFLLNVEKGSFYFAFDTKLLTRGDLLTRYQAYEIGAKSGFLQPDEIRYLEDMEPLGLEFIKLGLQDVLYDPKTKQIYTPNTDKTSKMNSESKPITEPITEPKGGDEE